MWIHLPLDSGESESTENGLNAFDDWNELDECDRHGNGITNEWIFGWKGIFGIRRRTSHINSNIMRTNCNRSIFGRNRRVQPHSPDTATGWTTTTKNNSTVEWNSIYLFIFISSMAKLLIRFIASKKTIVNVKNERKTLKVEIAPQCGGYAAVNEMTKQKSEKKNSVCGGDSSHQRHHLVIFCYYGERMLPSTSLRAPRKLSGHKPAERRRNTHIFFPLKFKRKVNCCPSCVHNVRRKTLHDEETGRFPILIV